MLKERTRSLRDRTVITAAILSLMGGHAYADGPLEGRNSNDHKTNSPIKHVIVIMGENRTFDHVFATYKAPHGEFVDNLLSKGIIKEDGTPGPNYAKATQYSAVDSTTYQLSPGGKVAYGSPSNPVQAPGTSYAPLTCYTNVYDPVTGAAVNGPGCMASLALAEQAETVADTAGKYALETPDLPLLTTGATGLSSNWPDSRVANYNSLPSGPYPLVTASGGSLYDTYGRQPCASLLSDVAAARLRRDQSHQA
jgi:phospholipase C